jgi:hypothetical protein
MGKKNQQPHLNFTLEVRNMGKKWYASKTLIVNALMLVAMFLSEANGIEIPSELQGSIMVIVNWVLRIVTNEPLKG